MAKVEIERGPLVGGVLIAVSAAIALALNTYSRPTEPVIKEAMPHVQHVESACVAESADEHKPACPTPDDQ
jgi:hypothetical protein